MLFWNLWFTYFSSCFLSTKIHSSYFQQTFVEFQLVKIIKFPIVKKFLMGFYYLNYYSIRLSSQTHTYLSSNWICMRSYKNSLMIPMGQSGFVNRRRADNTMTKRKRTSNSLQNNTRKTKDWVTRISLKTRGELRCSGKSRNLLKMSPV